MAYSKVSWAYKDPISVQKLDQMELNSVWTSEHKIIGCEIAITGTSTVEVSPGKIELNGNWFTETTTANLVLTAENNAHWREGTSQEVTSTAFYVYAYNSAGSTFSIKFGLSAPAYSDTASGTSIGPKQYDKSGSTWFRCIGAVLNHTGADKGDLIKYYQRGNRIIYDLPVNITTAQSVGAWSAALNCNPAIPKISTMGIFGLMAVDAAEAVAGVWIRPNGSTWSTNQSNGLYLDAGGANGITHGGQRICMTDSSQQIQHYSQAGDEDVRIDVEGYILNIR